MSVFVRFDAEIRLLDDELPEALTYRTVARAVQAAIGHTGAVVCDVTEYEEDSDR